MTHSQQISVYGTALGGSAGYNRPVMGRLGAVSTVCNADILEFVCNAGELTNVCNADGLSSACNAGQVVYGSAFAVTVTDFVSGIKI